MRILLLGGDGQVGWELRRSLAPLGEVIAPLRDRLDAAGCTIDLTQPDALADLVDRVRPDVVVNAAAYTAVDAAESNQATAQAVNGEAPGVLARAAERLGALFVHYSTDYVFDGSGSQRWREDDATGPLSTYGRTKLDGERNVAAATRRHLIFRTSWVYASRGGNFARTMLRLAGERDRLTVIDDQHGAPTGADLIADVTAHAIQRTLAQPQCCGLYHLAASGETTWNGYARFVVAHALRAGRALRVKPEGVEPVPTSAFPMAATRPLNSRLDTSRLCAAFQLFMPPWQQGVARMLDEVL